MGYLKYMKESWKKPDQTAKKIRKERLLQLRKEPVTMRVVKPTRIDRARALGYKAKQGFVIVRQKVLRGGHERPHDQKGRRSKHARRNMVLSKSYQQICEERVNNKFTNCEVLNSYFLAKDGQYIWYEVILIDRAHPQISSNSDLKNVAKQKGRVFRGLTSSGRKSRGLLNKGKGAEKLRPSRKAAYRRQHNKDAPEYRKRDNKNNK
jgi:large subunit ribosomal protein L15e